MSLIIKVTLSKYDLMTSDEVKSIQPEGGHIIAGLDVPKKSTKGSDIYFYDPENEILTDNADWDAETWDMNQDRLAEIAVMLEKLYKITKKVLVFEALWVGEMPTEEREVSIEEMVRIIQEGRIGTKTRYLIS